VPEHAADALRGWVWRAFESSRWLVEGLTDDEYFWEPVTPCWSVRSRDEASPGWGIGPWVCEDPWPHPDPPPVTTIAWRLVHLCAWTDVYRDWTFGAAQLGLPMLEVPGSADDACRWLHKAQTAFAAEVEGLRDTELDEPRPWHVGGTLPILSPVDAIAVEHAHHGAEIGLLRDLRRKHGRAGR
jgi:hypothetical protein